MTAAAKQAFEALKSLAPPTMGGYWGVDLSPAALNEANDQNGIATQQFMNNYFGQARDYPPLQPLRCEPRQVDHCSEAGALLLKARLEHYWSERGYSVSLTVCGAGFRPALRGVSFELRSDMKNGLPMRLLHRPNEVAPDATIGVVEIRSA